MPTSFVSKTSSEILHVFAVQLAVAARVFTTRQVACHPVVSWRTQPLKRVSESLAPYRNSFDVIPWTRDKPFLWRLSDREKQRLGVRYRNVGASQHAPHWLALGNVWMELVFNGLRPERWYNEGKKIGRFDVFAVIQGQPYLFEVQESVLSERAWYDKWEKRITWLRERPWQTNEWADEFSPKQPRVVLITPEPQKVLYPKGVLHVSRISDLPSALRRPPHK